MKLIIFCNGEGVRCVLLVESHSTMTTEEFKASVLPHYKGMFRVAAALMGSGDVAADAVQDAMLRLWDNREKLHNVADLKTYCMNVVRNVCLNTIQRSKDAVVKDAMPEVVSDEDVHKGLEWRDSAELVRRAIDRLPTDQRYVLRLSAYGGFSNAEIAELLGLSPGNVRILLWRARTRIKELLSK